MKLPMIVSVRGYGVPIGRKSRKKEPENWNPKTLSRPARERLVFDCETTADHTQSLRFGTYQAHPKPGKPVERGIFYEPKALTKHELSVVRAYADKHGLALRTRENFIDKVFYKYAFAYGALIVGFNLPFDLSRLAVAISTSRAHDMRNAFSLTLLPNRNLPNLFVKHLNARMAFMRFRSAKQPTGRSDRKKGVKKPARQGYFLDVKTLAAALLGKGYNLKRLAEVLGTQHRKLEAERHGAPITPEYLDYAMTDTQVTWECFEILSAMYDRHGLKLTPPHRIYSEASLGKAYLNQMHIAPLMTMQPDVPSDLIGLILGTYFGGRSEVRIRRQIVRVLYCDFRSMYPTVCTLMGLWRFVTAKGFDWTDWTDGARDLLSRVELGDLKDKAFWASLPVLVQIAPDDDVLPVRAAYDFSSRTIGLNYLSAAFPMWFTMADCIASKLEGGKTPNVVRAIKFTPRAMQDDLRPIMLAGDKDFLIDPSNGDFYRELILKRGRVQSALKVESDPAEHERQSALSMMLKLLANSTSYGIFAEQNVETYDRPRSLRLFGQERQFRAASISVEEPGSNFHPLIATLITGAARLMLACAERIASDNGLVWAFCDTDSLALARPEGMDDEEFLNRCQRVTGWFDGLDPYGDGKPLFKVEDQNFALKDRKVTDIHEPLYAIAISAKRYVLFNKDADGRPVVRKALAHGLGHLMEPYGEKDAPRSIPDPVQSLEDLEVRRWQHDLWYRIALAYLEGHPDRIDLSGMPQLDLPARSRYGANTAALRNWFKRFNVGKPLHKQVKCFNFLNAYQLSKPGLIAAIAKGEASDDLLADGGPAVVAPYSDDPAEALKHCFDRRTGKRVPASILKTYREVIAEYARHPESKFGNARETDSGITERRRIEVVALEYIGKEANRWEEQFYLGEIPEAQVVYGSGKADYERMLHAIAEAAHPFTQVALAAEAGISRQELIAILQRTTVGRPRTMRALLRAIFELKVRQSNSERDR